jgi:hypothetical protein
MNDEAYSAYRTAKTRLVAGKAVTEAVQHAVRKSSLPGHARALLTVAQVEGALRGALSNPSEPMILVSNASDSQVGALLVIVIRPNAGATGAVSFGIAVGSPDVFEAFRKRALANPENWAREESSATILLDHALAWARGG